MTPENYLELVHGLLGFSDVCRDYAAAIEQRGMHATLSDPVQLDPLIADVELLHSRLIALRASQPGRPPTAPD